MRIELPAASWSEVLLRAQDDTHTLTLPEPATAPCVLAFEAAPGEPPAPLHAGIGQRAALTTTLSLPL